jgi:trimeric autotransporter adhesin
MRTLLRVVAWVVVGTALVGSTVDAGAQTFQGGLRGAVKDAQGVIPGVTLTLTNEATGVSRDTVSNEAGEYSFPAVDPGNYVLKAVVQGFKTFERHGIRIATQTFVTLDVTLEVGTVEETITVTADAPLIETSNASHADVLDAKTLEILPSVGRNIFLMAVTVPTVQATDNTHWNRMQDQSGASNLAIGGGGVRANNYLLDGFPVTDLSNRSSTNPSGEMVEDVRVQVHTYDAEMGRTGGGVFNTTARSGTNQFHGSGYFQTRPTALVGPNFFNEIRGIPTNDQYWRNGGGGFGGPILRGKTFFWVAGEAYRDGQAQNSNLHVPTAAMRNGDFSGVTDAQGRPIIIYDPLTTDANGNRQPFPGNSIPANRINAVGRQLVSALPMPGRNMDDGNFNYFPQDIIKSSAHQGSVKIDHHFSDKISLNGLYLYQNSQEPNANYFPDAPYAAPSYQIPRAVNVLVFNNTYILNPTTVATFRYGMNTFSDDRTLPFEFDTHQLGWNPAFANSIPVQKFPSLTLTGYAGTGFTGVSDTNYYSWGLNGSVTKLAGSHSFKTGADYRILGVDALSYGQSAGSYTFNGQFTGSNANNPSATSRNAIADLLLGYPSSGTLTLNSRFDDYIRYYGFFVQDDWRLTEKLTVNYGVRLEHETGLAERDNQLVVGFDRNVVSPLNVTIPADAVAGTPARQVLGGLVYAGVDGAAEHVGSPPKVKMSPRFGMAYSINSKTVLRSGYGLFWAPWASGAQSAIGYSQTTAIQQNVNVPITSINDPFPSGLTPISGNVNGMLTGVSTSISFIDPDRDAPRVHQYSVDIQREIPGDMSVGLTYMGSTGRHLTFGADININQVDPKYLPLGSQLTQLVPNPFFGNPNAAGYNTRGATIQRNQLLRPFPQFDNVNMTQSTLGRSQYHAGVIQLTKRATGWWGGRISYTYSRLEDNLFGVDNYYSNAAGLLNNYTVIPWSPYFDLDAEYGRSRTDSPHKVAASPIIRLPFGQGRRWLTDGGWTEWVLGGWTVSAVIQMQSGFPLGVTQSVNNNNLLGSAARPNLVPGVEIRVPGSITDRLRANPDDNLYLNPTAFAQAPAGTFGNSPRLLPGIYSPWRNSTDLGINKDLNVGSGLRATLRLEIINLFDNPWYAALASGAQGNANFGRVNAQANYSRTFQLMARMTF